MPLTEEDTHVNVEVQELKQKVRRLAQDHSTRFHCGTGVIEAMREAGIDMENPGDTLRVRVDFTMFDQEEHYETEVDMLKGDLHGKTPEEQYAWAGEYLKPAVIMGDADIDLDIPITVWDLNAVTPPPARLPAGYEFYKVSNGRVAHIVDVVRRATLCGDLWVPRTLEAYQPEVGTPWCKRCTRYADANPHFRGVNTDVV